MDDFSAEMFENPTVRVGGYQESEEEIRGASQAIFGRVLTPEDFAELIAAPDGSELLITARRIDGDIELRLGYHWFNGTHDYILYKDHESDKRVVEFDNIAVREEAPELLETRLFARQVQSFRKFAIDEIRLYAEGYPNHPGRIGGYYVWPRLGFIIDLAGFEADLLTAGFDTVKNTLDLFSQPGGAEWWHHYGNEGPAVFYLEEGSPCLFALQSYRKKMRSILMHKPKTTTTRPSVFAASAAARPKRCHNSASGHGSTYQVTLVPQASLALIAEATVVKVVEAPRYDRLRDEPAFQKAWQKVAEARAQGKLAPLPSRPPGGIRLRGSHRKPSG